MKKKRIYRSFLGIPVWFITGLSIFLIFSTLYDIAVLDRSTIRYLILTAAILILIITVVLHFISLQTLSKMARRQMGG